MPPVIYEEDIQAWRQDSRELLSVVRDTDPVVMVPSLYSSMERNASARTFQEVIETLVTAGDQWADRCAALRFQVSDYDRQYKVMRRELHRLNPAEWPLPLEDEPAGVGVSGSGVSIEEDRNK
jgi:hypothetical protein